VIEVSGIDFGNLELDGSLPIRAEDRSRNIGSEVKNYRRGTELSNRGGAGLGFNPGHGYYGLGAMHETGDTADPAHGVGQLWLGSSVWQSPEIEISWIKSWGSITAMSYHRDGGEAIW
jgi:hypothetical protein